MNTRLLFCACVISLVGCAAREPMQWTKVRGDAQDLVQVTARCDYETTAATQGTDYSFRSSFGQELDRAIRKRDLEQRCMLANGYALQPVRAFHQESLPPRTPEQMEAAARNRAQASSSAPK